MSDQTCAVCGSGPHGDNRYTAGQGEHAYRPAPPKRIDRLTTQQQAAEDAFYNAPRGRRGRERG